MQDFVESFGFIIFFLILVLGISMTLGQKALYTFLWLVLLGMVFTGWPKIEALTRRYV
jgi:ABC-type dipeptide/oligopeptide/nickel transport system permease subunit